MKQSKGRIPAGVLEEIFPQKLSRLRASKWVYSRLKQQILSGEFKRGQRLFREEIAQNFNVSDTIVSRAFSQLEKNGLILVKGGVGSFVA